MGKLIQMFPPAGCTNRPTKGNDPIGCKCGWRGIVEGAVVHKYRIIEYDQGPEVGTGYAVCCPKCEMEIYSFDMIDDTRLPNGAGDNKLSQ